MGLPQPEALDDPGGPVTSGNLAKLKARHQRGRAKAQEENLGTSGKKQQQAGVAGSLAMASPVVYGRTGLIRWLGSLKGFF